jgi:hypothetical protein
MINILFFSSEILDVILTFLPNKLCDFNDGKKLIFTIPSNKKDNDFITITNNFADVCAEAVHVSYGLKNH